MCQVAITRGDEPPGADAAERIRYAMTGPWQLEQSASRWRRRSRARPGRPGATAVGAYNSSRRSARGLHLAGGDTPSRSTRTATDSRSRTSGASRDLGDGWRDTTFFFADTIRDADDLPNFFGTSASARGAAAIGALVLHVAAGGRAHADAVARPAGAQHVPARPRPVRGDGPDPRGLSIDAAPTLEASRAGAPGPSATRTCPRSATTARAASRACASTAGGRTVRPEPASPGIRGRSTRRPGGERLRRSWSAPRVRGSIRLGTRRSPVPPPRRRSTASSAR